MENSRKPAMVLAVSIVISIIALLIGLIGMVILTRLKTSPAEAKTSEHHIKVETLQVKKKDIPVFITGYGEVKTLKVVSIASEVPGKIVKIHPRLEIGEIIPKGELLFTVDPKDYLTIRKTGRKRLKILQRNYELAKNAFDRVRILLEKDNVGTRAGVETAEKVMLSVENQMNQISQILETTETNLKRCLVRASFNARIKSVSLEEGQYVTPGQSVVTLADDSVLEILVPLDSREARKWLRFDGDGTHEKFAWFYDLEKTKCQINWTEDNNGQIWEGRLHRIVKFDRQTRTITVAMRVNTETASKKKSLSLPLVEGMFCSVRIPGRTLRGVFKLPRQAVSFDDTVFVAVNNRLKTVPVKVARVEGESAYVEDGLNMGDMVVITRLINPLENALLQIINEKVTES